MFVPLKLPLRLFGVLQQGFFTTETKTWTTISFYINKYLYLTNSQSSILRLYSFCIINVLIWYKVLLNNEIRLFKKYKKFTVNSEQPFVSNLYGGKG